MLWTFTGGKVHFWLFPNLNNDSYGILESFKPLYSVKGLKRKKKGKKKDTAAKKEDTGEQGGTQQGELKEEEEGEDEEEEEEEEEENDDESAEGWAEWINAERASK